MPAALAIGNLTVTHTRSHTHMHAYIHVCTRYNLFGLNFIAEHIEASEYQRRFWYGRSTHLS